MRFVPLRSQGLQLTVLRMITDNTFPTPPIAIMREVLKGEWGHDLPTGHLVNALEDAYERIDELEAETGQSTPASCVEPEDLCARCGHTAAKHRTPGSECVAKGEADSYCSCQHFRLADD